MDDHLGQILAGFCAVLCMNPIVASAEDLENESVDNSFVYANISYLATEEIEGTDNQCFGDFINPSDIESIDEVIATFCGENFTITSDQFFDEDASNSLVCPKEYLQYENIFPMIELVNYNDTNCDLYYEYDPVTDKYYQTLNTATNDLNSIVHTRTQNLDSDVGDKTFRLHSSDIDFYMSGAEWILNQPDISYSIDELTHLKDVMISSTTQADGTYVHKNYKLFGSTWIPNYVNIKQLDEPIENNRFKYFYTSLFNNSHIISNVKTNDELEITYFVNADSNHYMLCDNYDSRMTFDYTTKEDNEELPLMYGNYLIHNKTTGIYDAINTYELDVVDYRLSLLKDSILSKFSYMLRYDIPPALNLRDKEYTTAMIIQLDGSDTDYIILNTSDILEAVHLIPDELKSLDYIKVSKYEIPINNSPLVIYDDMPYCISDAIQDTPENFVDIEYDYISNYLMSLQDEPSVSYYTVFGDVIYESTGVKGDANQDGVFDIQDIVLLQQWLLANPEYSMTPSGYVCINFCKDNLTNTFDLCLVKRYYLQFVKPNEDVSQ